MFVGLALWKGNRARPRQAKTRIMIAVILEWYLESPLGSWAHL